MSRPQFSIEQKLNESATTTVYRAFDEQLHRTVLLKVLQRHLADDEDLRQRFIREARACAALRSEHIVQVFDLTEIDGAPAIVMEFVEGRSLKEVIAAGTHRTAEFTGTVARHVLRALSAAHERGIVHRDIKPGNIMVAENGTVKVTDFGLAYVAQAPTVTMDGMVLGTPAYMAPEQVRGEDTDHRTDLFALGITLVETATGERLFEGASYSECIKKILGFSAADAERLAGASLPGHAALVKRLLHPVKQERFASAAEALSMIESVPQPMERNSPQRPRIQTFPLAGIAAASVIAVIVFVLFMSRETESTPAGSSRSFADSTNARSADSIETDVRPNVPDARMNDNGNQSGSIAANRVPAAAIPESGSVLITSTPWAKVYINNTLIGETPIALPVRLAAGEHSVMFTNPSFDPIMETVTVLAGRVQTVTGDFTQRAGYLQCVVRPWAEVIVNEQYKDTTPLSKPIMLSAGRHTVRFRNPSFSDIVRHITVTAMDTVTISVSFTP